MGFPPLAIRPSWRLARTCHRGAALAIVGFRNGRGGERGHAPWAITTAPPRRSLRRPRPSRCPIGPSHGPATRAGVAMTCCRWCRWCRSSLWWCWWRGWSGRSTAPTANRRGSSWRPMRCGWNRRCGSSWPWTRICWRGWCWIWPAALIRRCWTGARGPISAPSPKPFRWCGSMRTGAAVGRCRVWARRATIGWCVAWRNRARG